MTTQQQTVTTIWSVDKTHSNVDFTVKHLVISTVRGTFRDFDAALFIDETESANSRVLATVNVASIDTNEETRDAHLRSDDFFNSDLFPKMIFESTRIERRSDDKFLVIGNLTIRDVTREVVLKGAYEGRIQDPWGNDRIAFSAETEISRNDFNVRWNQLLETGGAVLGDKVKINLYVEAVRNAE